MTLSNRPLLPAGEREDECGPKLILPWLSKLSWDPETETTASCRDKKKKKNQIIHPALLRGRERCTYPLPKQFPLYLGRPSRGLLLLCLPPAEEASLGYGNLEEPTLSASLCQPDTARGGAPGPQLSAASTRTRSRRRKQLRPFVEVTEPGRNSEMSIHSEKMTYPRTPPQRATAQAREAAIVTIHPAPGNDRIQKPTGDTLSEARPNSSL